MIKRTLHEIFAATTDQYSDKLAIQIKCDSGYRQYSYKQLNNAALNIAYYLINHEIKKGDKVAIFLENCPEWAMIYFGILYAGAIAVPLDPQTSAVELKHCLTDSETKIIFINEQNDQKLEAISLSKLNEIIKHQQPSCKLPTITPQTIASILYTSGTTGKPKGVMLSHGNFAANYTSVKKLNMITATDNILAVLPLHHSFPFMVTLLLPLFSGGMITYLTTLKTDEMLTCMQETCVTVLVGVPQLYSLLGEKIHTEFNKISWYIKAPINILINTLHLLRNLTGINLNKLALKKIHARFGGKLRFFCCGGAKLNINIAKYLTKIGFTILEGYGLTETAPVDTFNPQKHTKLGSAGTAIPGVTIKIDGPDQNGIGEIIIHGNNVMQSYYKHPKQTKEAIKDGWLYSGDLGYIDHDGYLFITGRKKELIVLSSGKNITPDEVENHYQQSQYIKELIILTTSENGEEQLKAVVVPDMDVFRSRGLVNIHGTIKWDLENLSKDYPPYKRITGFIIAKNELPRTRLGKLKRYAIKEQYLDKLLDTKQQQTNKEIITGNDLKLLSSDLTKQIITVISATANNKNSVQLSHHLELDLSFDSLHRIELMAALEKQLNIHIPDTKMAHIFTVRELITTIQSLKPQKGKLILEDMTKTFSWSDILTTTPSAEIVQKIELAENKKTQRYTHILCAIIYTLGKLYWRLKAVNNKQLPINEPIIYCANHASYLDSGFIAATMPRTLIVNTFFLGFRSYFSSKFMRWTAKIFRIIPINQASELVDALQTSSYILRKGKSICIFPAGMRSINGKVQEFRNGVGVLAKELNVRLVPIYLSGTYESLSRNTPFPKPHPIKIIYDRPYKPDELQTEGYKLGANNDYEAITLAIREKIIQLKKLK